MVTAQVLPTHSARVNERTRYMLVWYFLKMMPPRHFPAALVRNIQLKEVHLFEAVHQIGRIWYVMKQIPRAGAVSLTEDLSHFQDLLQWALCGSLWQIIRLRHMPRYVKQAPELWMQVLSSVCIKQAKKLRGTRLGNQPSLNVHPRISSALN